LVYVRSVKVIQSYPTALSKYKSEISLHRLIFLLSSLSSCYLSSICSHSCSFYLFQGLLFLLPVRLFLLKFSFLMFFFLFHFSFILFISVLFLLYNYLLYPYSSSLSSHFLLLNLPPYVLILPQDCSINF
jgi:hypothetical protein